MHMNTIIWQRSSSLYLFLVLGLNGTMITHTLIPPPKFLSWIMFGLIQSNSSIGNINIAAILLIYFFTLYYNMDVNKYGFQLVDLAYSFSSIIILPSSSLILFIFVKFYESTYFLSRVATLDTISSPDNLQWKPTEVGILCRFQLFLS